jgi:hypothetical protein
MDSMRRCMSIIRRGLVAGLLAGVAWFAAGRADAEAIALKFEATVESLGQPEHPWTATELRGAPPLALPVGDVIRGSLFFDPSIPFNETTNWTQATGISLVVDGELLQAPALSANVMNDRRWSFVTWDAAYSGPVYPDLGIALGDRFAPPESPVLDDRIELTHYLGLNEATPETTPWRWQPTIELSGPTSVIDIENFLPNDAATWNAFTTKTLRFGLDTWVTLPDGSSMRDFVTATATISSFAPVPEPASRLCACLAVAGTAGVRRTRRR